MIISPEIGTLTDPFSIGIVQRSQYTNNIIILMNMIAGNRIPDKLCSCQNCAKDSIFDSAHQIVRFHFNSKVNGSVKSLFYTVSDVRYTPVALRVLRCHLE